MSPRGTLPGRKPGSEAYLLTYCKGDVQGCIYIAGGDA